MSWSKVTGRITKKNSCGITIITMIILVCYISLKILRLVCSCIFFLHLIHIELTLWKKKLTCLCSSKTYCVAFMQEQRVWVLLIFVSGTSRGNNNRVWNPHCYSYNWCTKDTKIFLWHVICRFGCVANASVNKSDILLFFYYLWSKNRRLKKVHHIPLFPTSFPHVTSCIVKFGDYQG